MYSTISRYVLIILLHNLLLYVITKYYYTIIYLCAQRKQLINCFLDSLHTQKYIAELQRELDGMTYIQAIVQLQIQCTLVSPLIRVCL